MHSKQLKVGMKVLISSNIDCTAEALNSCPEMELMAGDGKEYIISQVNSFSNKGPIAKIGDYSWMPEDLIDVEKGYLDPVPLKGKKVTFDLCEL